MPVQSARGYCCVPVQSATGYCCVPVQGLLLCANVESDEQYYWLFLNCVLFFTIEWKDYQFSEYWPGWDQKIQQTKPHIKNIGEIKTIDIKREEAFNSMCMHDASLIL